MLHRIPSRRIIAAMKRAALLAPAIIRKLHRK